MNFDYWEGELGIYEPWSTHPDEGCIVTLWHTGKDQLVLKLEDGYKIESKGDFLIIRKNQKERRR